MWCVKFCTALGVLLKLLPLLNWTPLQKEIARAIVKRGVSESMKEKEAAKKAGVTKAHQQVN